jgi:hypothetical protein
MEAMEDRNKIIENHDIYQKKFQKCRNCVLNSRRYNGLKFEEQYLGLNVWEEAFAFAVI